MAEAPGTPDSRRARRSGLESARKRRALIEVWNSLAKGRAVRANPDSPQHRATAGRLLELCHDSRERFQRGATRFLSQTWRSETGRTLLALERWWSGLGETAQKLVDLEKPPQNAGNAGAYGIWKKPSWWDSPPADLSWMRNWKP